MRRYAGTAAAALAAALTVGCGGGATVVPVSGKVYLNGQPLSGATVSFQPLSDASWPASTGVTDAQGGFTLSLVNGKGPGAIVGPHRVAVSALQGPAPDSADDNPKVRKDKVPSNYNSNTSLKFDVPAGGTTTAEFKLLTNSGS